MLSRTHLLPFWSISLSVALKHKYTEWRLQGSTHHSFRNHNSVSPASTALKQCRTPNDSATSWQLQVFFDYRTGTLNSKRWNAPIAGREIFVPLNWLQFSPQIATEKLNFPQRGAWTDELPTKGVKWHSKWDYPEKILLKLQRWWMIII